ncbi:MAG TPA: ATP-binding protein [Thermoanaerobaculia bacterium]|jgi:signal transduction histidine kinase|nr:ATP-binding protein [Thermoanaerobaculia bacterium]
MRPIVRYTLAVLLFAAAAFAQSSFTPVFGNRPFFLFFCAVFASAIFCGLGPSLLAIVLSSAFLVRYGGFHSQTEAFAQTLVFAALGVALTAALSKRREADLRGERATTEQLTLDVEASRRAEEMMRMLNEVSDILSASLDYEETIPAAVRLATKHLGDWCAVSFVDDEGQARRVAVAHRDAQKDIVAQRMMTEFPPRRDLPRPVTKSINLQKPTILNALDEQFLVRASSGPEHAALVRELGFGSMLVAPMVARGKTIGALTFLSAQPGRYTDNDASLGELIARRAAIAIDNAQLYRAAVEASNAKDEFLATISHELRTPMTATLGWVRMLNLGHFDPETHKTALDAIERSTRAQAKLIEDILDVSSIVLGKFRLDREPVDLRAVVDAAIETLRPASEAKQITIHVDTSRWNGVVAGDPDRLQQVMWNLISNAIKFGHRNGQIDVTVERADHHARITVHDDGPGIDPAFLPFVFDRFRQADSGATRSHGGLGLGLAIVRHLTELHGGGVRAMSDGAGKGSTFIVELPESVAPLPGDDAKESMLSFHPPT